MLAKTSVKTKKNSTLLKFVTNDWNDDWNDWHIRLSYDIWSIFIYSNKILKSDEQKIVQNICWIYNFIAFWNQSSGLKTKKSLQTKI